MEKTLDLNFIRYLNLFEKITKVRTDTCFILNNVMFFAVPKGLIYRAVGEKGNHIKQLSEILGKRIRVVGMPEQGDMQDIRQFMIDIISPIQVKNVDVTETEVIINAGSKMAKAGLMGRDKAKLKELEKITKDYFGKDLKII